MKHNWTANKLTWLLLVPVSNQDRIGRGRSKRTKKLHTSCTLTPKMFMQNAQLLLGGQRPRQPIETFIEAVAGCRTRRLDEPLTVSKIVQSKLLRDLGCWHSIRKILLV